MTAVTTLAPQLQHLEAPKRVMVTREQERKARHDVCASEYSAPVGHFLARRQKKPASRGNSTLEPREGDIFHAGDSTHSNAKSILLFMIAVLAKTENEILRASTD